MWCIHSHNIRRVRPEKEKKLFHLNFEKQKNFKLKKMSVTINTDAGPLKIELYCKQVPKSCENFLALCASGYYEGSVFHRNIPG